ncbi:MAG TPA: DUF2007 domain-containing protein [Phycisphaerae bacterium]|nr:DUF2007 domain-containing protein [Phycisphaerae bacterium]
MSRDLPCVYRAADIEEAKVVVAWLSEQGIAALVKDEHAAAMMQTSLIVAPEGIEVCVTNAEDAARATALLRDHFARKDRRGSPDAGPVAATCEECGRTSEFPAAQGGSVQNCPHCKAYIDVPEATEG